MNKLIAILLLICPINILANGITVSGVSFDNVTNEISFTLEWQNSWTYFVGIPDLHDAAWVFIKYAPNGGDNWLHAEILDSIPVQHYFQYISYDDLGVMIFKSTEGLSPFGPQEFTVELAPMLGGYQDFKVFATEMVFIDNGPFNAGDGVSSGRFYADGATNVPWMVTSEAGIMRGNGVGQFNQEGSSSTQHLTSDFPKGYESIFCMKYKITAQQYVDFLNCLSRAQQDTRVKADLTLTSLANKYVMTDTATPTDRNPIACDPAIGTGCIEFYVDLDDTNPPNSANDGANIVLNNLTPSDILAYLDWSGLRPMTELEYEKICRGVDMPAVAEEYAWGNDTYNAAGTIINSGANDESTNNVGVSPGLYTSLPLRAGYAATGTSNRTEASAAFFGVMDIHNLGELMYGVESSNFKWSSYGNGNLSPTGNADVSDWNNGAQLLSTSDSSTPFLDPISKQKHSISLQTRSAYIGGRGMRRLISL